MFPRNSWPSAHARLGNRMQKWRGYKMRRYYVAISDVDWVVRQLNRQQNKKGIFVNIAVRAYHGKKYDPQNTVVIVVG